MTSNEAFAYLAWLCSLCDGETVSTNQRGADLLCETCGHLYRITGQHATLVPNPDEDDEIEDQ